MTQANPAYTYFIAAVAAVGGFLFGFDLSIVGGAAIFVREQFQLDPEQLGFGMRPRANRWKRSNVRGLTRTRK